MKLFKTLFDLVTLPVSIAVDTLMAFPESAEGEEIFRRTKNKIEDLDEDLES